MNLINDGFAITLKLTPAQHQWLEKAARQMAELQGRSVSQSAVLLKLMELGLPFLEAELRQGAKLAQDKEKKRQAPKPSARQVALSEQHRRTLKLVPLTQ